MSEPTDEPGSTPAQPQQPPVGSSTGSGFSNAEKVIGVVAGYEAPLVSSLTASYLLRSETDPEKRRQLERWRKWSLGWLAVGVAVAIIGLIVVVSFAASHGVGGGGANCRGGIDQFDVMGTTYESDGGNRWTATYPCTDGGYTTVPIPARSVPGGGDFS